MTLIRLVTGKTATEGAQQKSYDANAVNEYVTAGSANLTYDLDGI